jgi:hypothetical protein
MRIITDAGLFIMNISDGDVPFFREELAAGRVDAGKTNTGNTLLHVAVTFGKIEAVRALLDHGADPNRAGNRGRLPLHLAGANEELLRLLIGSGANVFGEEPAGADYGGDPGPTALHRAVKARNLAGCRLLVSAGLSPSYTPNAAPPDYLTPMQSAIASGICDIVRYFVLECGEDPWQVTGDGRSLDELEPMHCKEISALREVRLARSSRDAVEEAIGKPGRALAGAARECQSTERVL